MTLVSCMLSYQDMLAQTGDRGLLRGFTDCLDCGDVMLYINIIRGTSAEKKNKRRDLPCNIHIPARNKQLVRLHCLSTKGAHHTMPRNRAGCFEALQRCGERGAYRP